jgi:hypothetical protein
MQFDSVVSPKARMFESLTNPIAVIPFPSSSGRRVDVKNRNRIRDSVDPYGIPVVCGRMQSVCSLILRHVVLSLRKDWMKRVIQGRKAFALRL